MIFAVANWTQFAIQATTISHGRDHRPDARLERQALFSKDSRYSRALLFPQKGWASPVPYRARESGDDRPNGGARQTHPSPQTTATSDRLLSQGNPARADSASGRGDVANWALSSRAAWCQGTGRNDSHLLFSPYHLEPRAQPTGSPGGVAPRRRAAADRSHRIESHSLRLQLPKGGDFCRFESRCRDFIPARSTRPATCPGGRRQLPGRGWSIDFSYAGPALLRHQRSLFLLVQAAVRSGGWRPRAPAGLSAS